MSRPRLARRDLARRTDSSRRGSARRRDQRDGRWRIVADRAVALIGRCGGAVGQRTNRVAVLFQTITAGVVGRGPAVRHHETAAAAGARRYWFLRRSDSGRSGADHPAPPAPFKPRAGAGRRGPRDVRPDDRSLLITQTNELSPSCLGRMGEVRSRVGTGARCGWRRRRGRAFRSTGLQP